VITAAKGSSAPLSMAVSSGYGPADLSSAYNITDSSSSTATIAIIDAGVDANLATDLAAYRTNYGLPACTTANDCLTLANYTGGPQPAPQASGDGAKVEEEIAVETALDVDMASAACPSCHILEISVPWADGDTDGDGSENDFSQAVSTAALAGAKAISISYGYTPSANTTSGVDLVDFLHPGVAIEVSTGDKGFNGGTHATWPSDLPYVIGVGGTQLSKNGDSWSEKAWGVDSGKGAAGSGCETYFPAANGQPTTVTQDCDNHLAAASVSADASPATPLAIYDSYTPYTSKQQKWLLVGGTSASSPYIAGLFARAGVPLYLLGPNTLYAAASSNFRDIISGNNELKDSCSKYTGVNQAVCNAGTGWDGPTGLGTPQGLGAF
jgi:subtilase family serine protease